MTAYHYSRVFQYTGTDHTPFIGTTQPRLWSSIGLLLK